MLWQNVIAECYGRMLNFMKTKQDLEMCAICNAIEDIKGSLIAIISRALVTSIVRMIASRMKEV